MVDIITSKSTLWVLTFAQKFCNSAIRKIFVTNYKIHTYLFMLIVDNNKLKQSFTDKNKAIILTLSERGFSLKIMM